MTKVSHWQIRDAEGRILADHLRWAVACDVLSAMQHHNMKVTLHQITVEVSQ